MIVSIPEDLGYGLTEYLQGLGVSLYQKNNTWHADGDGDIQGLIDSYNPWPIEKAKKFAEIDSDFEEAVTALIAGWPAHEMQTWSKQEAEARAFALDPMQQTPMLSLIAATRGLTVAELASRVIRDADSFTNASAYYVGLRHQARQLVQALPDFGQHGMLADLWSIRFGG